MQHLSEHKSRMIQPMKMYVLIAIYVWYTYCTYVLLFCDSTWLRTVRTNKHAQNLGIAKSYRLFNAAYTPWGVRRSTYSFLLYAHPYVHVDSLWKWCTTPRRFTCDLGAFGSVTYYLGLVRGVADVSETHPWYFNFLLPNIINEWQHLPNRQTSIKTLNETMIVIMSTR